MRGHRYTEVQLPEVVSVSAVPETCTAASLSNTFRTSQAESLTTPVLRHMEQNRCKWHFVKEDNPLQYSILLNDFYNEVH